MINLFCFDFRSQPVPLGHDQAASCSSQATYALTNLDQDIKNEPRSPNLTSEEGNSPRFSSSSMASSSDWHKILPLNGHIRNCSIQQCSPGDAHLNSNSVEDQMEQSIHRLKRPRILVDTAI